MLGETGLSTKDLPQSDGFPGVCVCAVFFKIADLLSVVCIYVSYIYHREMVDECTSKSGSSPLKNDHFRAVDGSTSLKIPIILHLDGSAIVESSFIYKIVKLISLILQTLFP